MPITSLTISHTIISIVGGYISEFEIENSDLINVESANQTSLTIMTLNDNAITDIKCSQNSAIQKLLLYGNPICSNTEKLTALCNSLPDRNNWTYGCIIIGNLDTLNVRSAERQFLLKDWYFGSTLQFDTTASEKIDDKLIQAGIPDIWESAEYGNGMTACIMDSCLRDTLSNITYSNFLGGWNVADNTSNYQPTDNELNPTYDYHGGQIASIICGNGTLSYGLCPNAKFYFARVCHTGNIIENDTDFISEYKSAMEKAISWNNEHNIDAANLSWKSQVTTSDYYEATLQNMISNGIQQFCSGGNDNDSASKYPRLNTEAQAIGAATSKTVIASYSCHYDGMDFAGFTNIVAEKVPNSATSFSGTSCASAFACGMYLLIKKIMWKKYDTEPTCAEVIAEMKKRTLLMANYDSTYQGAGLLLLNERNHRQDN